jgi:hypothetical protein
MTHALDAAGRSTSPAGVTGGQTPLSKPETPGISETKSSISTAIGAVGPVTRGFGTMIWRGIIFIPSKIGKSCSHIWNWVLDKIYGKGRTPAETVKVEKTGWFGGKYTVDMSLDAAIDGKYLTPEGTPWTAEYAIRNKKCDIDYATQKGWNIVEFEYKGWTGTSQLKMKLSSAVRDGYFTWQQAIDRKFITKEQAIKGGWINKETSQTSKTMK